MKTIKTAYIYTVSIALSLLVLIGCSDDFLDRLPENKIASKTFWKTKNDAVLALNGCYEFLDLNIYQAYKDGYADNAYCQYPWESLATVISAGSINTDMDAGYDYKGIRRFNYFLDNVDKAPLSDNEKKQYKAEVRALRALCYFLLINKFGAVPLLKKYVEEEGDAAIPPSSEQEVRAFVLAELKAVIPSLPQPATLKSRMSKAAAIALKARIHLFYKQWSEAASTAKEVMDLGTYQLFQVSSLSDEDMVDDYTKFVTFASDDAKKAFYKGLRSYEQLFWNKNQGNSEVILEKEYIKDSKWDKSSGINTLFFSDNAGGGWSSITPTVALVNAYWKQDGTTFTAPDVATRTTNYNKGEFNEAYLEEFKDRDTRLYASILFPGAIWSTLEEDFSFSWAKGGRNTSKTGYNFRKMTDPTVKRSMWEAPQNFPVIRYAEILLIYAEAKNEASGPESSIYDALDLIRERVAMPKVDRAQYNTKESLRKLIRNERRIELAAEGFRWDDIRRWDTAKDLMKTIYAIDNSLVQERRWDQKYKKLPYPQKAVDRNPNLKKPQTQKGY